MQLHCFNKLHLCHGHAYNTINYLESTISIEAVFPTTSATWHQCYILFLYSCLSSLNSSKSAPSWIWVSQYLCSPAKGREISGRTPGLLNSSFCNACIPGLFRICAIVSGKCLLWWSCGFQDDGYLARVLLCEWNTSCSGKYLEY